MGSIEAPITIGNKLFQPSVYYIIMSLRTEELYV
jgi:hypothetical protein